LRPPAVRSAVPWNTCAFVPTVIFCFYIMSRNFSRNVGGFPNVGSALGRTFCS
jgi:hypothetical protein